MLSVFQQAVGINAVLYYAPRIYEAMGFGQSDGIDRIQWYREPSVSPV